MRTTIDLPDDVHRAAVLIARDRQQTLSRTVSDLLRLAMTGASRGSTVDISPVSGLPLVRVGRRITQEDVQAAEEEA
jgi:hypothetical protein